MKMKIKVKLAEKKVIPVKIQTEFIKLESALKLSNVVTTGGIAKMLIQDGLVKVNGEVCLARGKKLRAGDEFQIENVIYKIEK